MSEKHHQRPHKRRRVSPRCKTSSTYEGSASDQPVTLPYGARPLTKVDLRRFEPLLAYYLSIQKDKDIKMMDRREVHGRWKSFFGKWNRGELAEGWYDPSLYTRLSAEISHDRACFYQAKEMEADTLQSSATTPQPVEDDDESYGPALPPANRSRQVGVGIPGLQDISARNEFLEESREDERERLRAARIADRVEQKQHLDELLPRADAGTRERKLEKRRETNEKMRDFRETSPGIQAGNETELMGGGDSVEEYKKMKELEQRRKSAREVRREEIERAKREEIEERRRAWQEREDDTMTMLKELAKQRFG